MMLVPLFLSSLCHSVLRSVYRLPSVAARYYKPALIARAANKN